MTTDIADRRFIVGIDLGTTNCAVSYVDLLEKGAPGKRIRIFKVPQMTGPGEVNRLPVLPSFLYIPGEFDISREAIVELWDNSETNFSGAFARDHGARVPARLVSSAKSWLCHANVDRRARILPWGADKEIPKVSPVAATASYLKHIRLAWNNSWGQDESLSKLLAESNPREVKYASTLWGPHRADVQIRVDGAAAGAVLSRGQGKLVASALQLGQASLLAESEQRTTVFLIDDAGAELDVAHNTRFFNVLERLGGQILATTTRYPGSTR